MKNQSDTENKKIIFVTISMRGGGTERVISLLADYWVSQGRSVDIMMIGDTKIEYTMDDQVNVYSVSEATGGSLRGRINRLIRMRQIIKQDRNNVVIAMGTVAAMFTAVAKLGLKNRLIVSERNDPNRLNHRPIKAYEKMLRSILYSTADRIVFQTNMAADCFSKRLQDKGSIILNPLNIDVAALQEYERENTIITAGRLTEQKNHKLLIDAFEEFLKSNPKYQLLIFGKGEMEEELTHYIEQKGLTEAVFLRGFSDNLHDELRKAKVYVSSSDWEGISNSLAEAMACGIPVIATDCPMGGSAMLIEDGINGILIPIGNKEELVKAMKRLVSDENVYQQISSNGSGIVKKFDIKTIADEWEALF